jgi:hypothetical protein
MTTSGRWVAHPVCGRVAGMEQFGELCRVIAFGPTSFTPSITSIWNATRCQGFPMTRVCERANLAGSGPTLFSRCPRRLHSR